MVHIKERIHETIKLRPAKDKPKADHWTLSQEEIGVLLSLLSNCFGLRSSISFVLEQEKTLPQYLSSSPK